MPLSLLDSETSASVVSLIVGSEEVTGGTRHFSNRVSGGTPSFSITVSVTLAFARLLSLPAVPFFFFLLSSVGSATRFVPQLVSHSVLYISPCGVKSLT